jgi:hypothetical protein
MIQPPVPPRQRGGNNRFSALSLKACAQQQQQNLVVHDNRYTWISPEHQQQSLAFAFEDYTTEVLERWVSLLSLTPR